MEHFAQANQLTKITRESEIDELLKKRWSPRSFKDESIPDRIIRKIFVAGSTSMSSFNEQPWHIILTTKADPQYKKLVACLSELNAQWVHTAPYLGAIICKKYFSKSNKENRHRLYDCGAFMAYASLEATALGYQIHQMAGFSPGKLMLDLQIPLIYEPAAMFVIGQPDSPDQLPVHLQKNETQKSTRKPLSSFLFSAKWGESYDLR